ncbi:MAG: hypothetical protein WEE20_09060 [Bacteroidota bacterium]
MNHGLDETVSYNKKRDPAIGADYPFQGLCKSFTAELQRTDFIQDNHTAGHRTFKCLSPPAQSFIKEQKPSLADPSRPVLPSSQRNVIAAVKVVQRISDLLPFPPDSGGTKTTDVDFLALKLRYEIANGRRLARIHAARENDEAGQVRTAL